MTDYSKNFKGIFQKKNDKEAKFYENGAHFKYDELYKRLEFIKNKQEPYLNLDQKFKNVINITSLKTLSTIKSIDVNTINVVEEKNKNKLAIKLLNSFDKKIDLLKNNVDKFSIEAIKTLQKLNLEKNNDCSLNIPKLILKQKSKSQSNNEFFTIKNYKETIKPIYKELQYTNITNLKDRESLRKMNQTPDNLIRNNSTKTQSRNTFNNKDKSSYRSVDIKKTWDKRSEYNKSNGSIAFNRISVDLRDSGFFCPLAKKTENRITFIQNNIIKAKLNVNDNNSKNMNK